MEGEGGARGGLEDPEEEGWSSVGGRLRRQKEAGVGDENSEGGK